MDQRKKSAHVVSIANGRAASDRTGVEVSQRKSTAEDTHWDFLDDIEAPMWVDLTQEFQFTYQDRDDEWFNISHPFHHCSSQQLISAFTSAREGCTKLDLSVQEQCSPKLPASVSRSRGKDYRSRIWGQANEKVTFSLHHSVKNLKNKPSSAISITEKVSRDTTSNGKPSGLGGSQSDSSEKSSLTEIDGKHDQSVISLGNQKLLLCSTSFKGAESNLTSNITSEGSEEQRQKSSELSSQLPDQTSRFLSALKISLRKSCVTRQASRVQVTERRQSEGQNSSSSKSSVGSSLTHGCDSKDLTGRDNKDMTPDSRCVPGVTMASSDKVNVVKNSSTTNPKPRIRCTALPSSKHQNTQGKVLQQTAKAKVLVPHSVNEHSSAAATMKRKEKAIATTGHQVSAGAKENLSKDFLANTRMRANREVVQVQKVIRRKLPENNAKTKLVGQKEKLGHGGEGKSGTMAQKAYYFR